MAGLFGCGLEHLFYEYLNSSDSEGDKDSGSEDALVGASDNGDSSECTTRTSSDIQVRALEDMLSGETHFVNTEPMDGLEAFLHSSMLDYPAFANEASATQSSACSWKLCQTESSSAWQPASNDHFQGQQTFQPLKFDPSLAPGPVKAPVPAQDGAPTEFSPGLIGGAPPPGGRSLAEIRERELDRRARVERYRQKRRERAFVKKIRYEVRKINAEQRPRYKGRFIKQEELAAMKQREGSA